MRCEKFGTREAAEVALCNVECDAGILSQNEDTQVTVITRETPARWVIDCLNDILNLKYSFSTRSVNSIDLLYLTVKSPSAIVLEALQKLGRE